LKMILSYKRNSKPTYFLILLLFKEIKNNSFTKNSIMKIKLLLVLVLPLFIQAQPQPKSEFLDEKSNEKLLKMMDQVVGPIFQEINFGLHGQEFYENIDDIPEGTNYNDEYLNELLEKYKKDSLDIYNLNNLGNYFNHFEIEDKAKKYFTEALEHINLKHFEQDSSTYFSFKGSFKFHLDDSTALYDFEKSLKINPQDTIANMGYPMALMKFYSGNEKALEKLRQLIDVLDDYDALNYYFYHALFSSMNQLALLVQEYHTESESSLIKSENFEDFFDFDQIYYDDKRFKSDKYVKSMKAVLNLLLLSIKNMFWILEQEDIFLGFNGTINKNQKKDIKKNIKSLKKLQKKGVLNDYLYNRSMSMAYFNLGDFNTSEIYAKLAIEEFPFEKQSHSFTADPVFDQLFTIYYLNQDIENFKNTMTLKERKTNKESSSALLVNLAYLYFKTKDIEKAVNYSKKALDEDDQNLNALKLLFHIYFLKEMPPIYKLYNDKLYNALNDDEDFLEYVKYMVLTYIFLGDFEQAKEKIDLIIENNVELDFCEQAQELILNNQ